MKKKLMLSFIAVVAAAGSLMAQSVQESQTTPEYKTKAAVTKVATELSITEAQRVKLIPIFNSYYKRLAMAPTGNDKANRDAKLKAVLTEEQMKSFKEKIEAKID